jgi:hypothetical protein
MYKATAIDSVEELFASKQRSGHSSVRRKRTGSKTLLPIYASFVSPLSLKISQTPQSCPAGLALDRLQQLSHLPPLTRYPDVGSHKICRTLAEHAITLDFESQDDPRVVAFPTSRCTLRDRLDCWRSLPSEGTRSLERQALRSARPQSWASWMPDTRQARI